MATKKKSAPAKPAKKAAGGGPAPTPPQQPQQQGAQLSILVQYVKDLSFESPNAPASLRGPGDNPQMNVNVNVQATAQQEGLFEVALNFDAKAANNAGVIYNIELVYAGIFRIQGVPQQYLQQILFVDCPMLLFPFARRIIADMTQEGAFPPLLLDPVDFARLYREKSAEIAQSATNMQA